MDSGPIRQTYDAFLSSGFSEFSAPPPFAGPSIADFDLKPLREETRALFESQDKSLWTWEHWRCGPEGERLLGADQSAQVPIFTQIAVFRRALIASRVMILFVANRRGSQIEPWGDGLRTYGTFLELEVFFAIALRKPIILLREVGGRLEAPLESLLGAARRAGTIWHEEWINRGALPATSLAAFLELAEARRSSVGVFTSLLAWARDPKLDFHTAMPFLFGVTLSPIGDVQKHPNLDVIDRLLDEERREPAMSERLSRLWLAIQELLSARQELTSDPDLAGRWLRGLDRWSSAASWFGMHAHLGVSPFTAHSERARIIEVSSPRFDLMPFGPLASARYSIARREAFGLRRYREFNKVIADCKRALEIGKGDQAGYLSIMGHALIQNARLLSAIEAFKQSLNLRQREGVDARVGEGECDLGFALFLTFQYRRGIRMMEEGIVLLEGASNPGFRFKSMRKLELAYRLSGRSDLARRLRARRTREASEAEMFDQA